MRRAVLFLALFAVTRVAGQGIGPDVNKYLAMINNGRADEVRRDIPTLLSEYPNDPGVLYVQGLVTQDGAEAVRIYQSIVDNFPHCEWADDALYKVYQYYYALGLYRTAELKMAQLRHDYPASKYLAAVADTSSKNIPEARRADTTAAAASQPANPPEIRPQFTLQVGAYTTQVNAEKQKLFFEDLGFPVEVNSKIKDNRSLFIVLVGTFASTEEARAKAQEFKQKYNIAPLVVTK